MAYVHLIETTPPPPPGDCCLQQLSQISGPRRIFHQDKISSKHAVHQMNPVPQGMPIMVVGGLRGAFSGDSRAIRSIGYRFMQAAEGSSVLRPQNTMVRPLLWLSTGAISAAALSAMPSSQSRASKGETNSVANWIPNWTTRGMNLIPVDSCFEVPLVKTWMIELLQLFVLGFGGGSIPRTRLINSRQCSRAAVRGRGKAHPLSTAVSSSGPSPQSSGPVRRCFVHRGNQMTPRDAHSR